MKHRILIFFLLFSCLQGQSQSLSIFRDVTPDAKVIGNVFYFRNSDLSKPHNAYYGITPEVAGTLPPGLGWELIVIPAGQSSGILPELPPDYYSLLIADPNVPYKFASVQFGNGPGTVAFTINFDGDNDNPSMTDMRDVLAGYSKRMTVNIEDTAIGNQTGQAFYISANTKNVEIRYTCEQSLQNAIYTYLDMLGIHWYGPGEDWLVKQPVLNTLNIAGEWRAPSFRNRSFFGTGGLDFAGNPIYDPTNSFKVKWFDFERRNRYNVDFPQTGHAGQAFYLSNKTVLDAHPEWFNGEVGMVNGRFKIEYSEVVNLYKTWAAAQYSPNNLFNTIGVDPEDGRGGPDDPLPPDGFQGLNDWTVSDKWWWLANEVAKLFDEDDVNIAVSMYAYGDGPYNALIPRFPLRKNVYPVIIPYAFQTAYLPNEMIKAWGNTIDGNMGIYDYWNITQWSSCLPQFSMSSIKDKLTFWNANKINGINQETTDAAGPMGHIFWLAGQLEWDVTKDFNTLYTQYLNDCFGAAAPAMRKMYNRWSYNYQGNADYAFSLQNLEEATQLVTVNSPQWKRINDMKAYVHYMKLMAERDGTTAKDNAIFQYMYTIHDLMMIHTSSMVQFRWFNQSILAPTPVTATQLTADEIEQQFLNDYANVSVDYTISDFIFDIDRVSYTDPIVDDTWLFGILNNSEFFKATFTGTVNITAGAEGNTPIKVFTEDGIVLNDTVGISNYNTSRLIDGNKLYYLKDLSFNIVAGKTYYIKAEGRSKVQINTPGIVLFHNQGGEDYDNYSYPRKYFYVPLDATEIVWWDGGNGANDANGAGMYNPDGVKVTKQPTGAQNIFKVPVLPSQRGKIWYGTFGYPSWSLKNIPNFVSMQKFGYNE